MTASRFWANIRRPWKPCAQGRGSRGFTLIEMLVSMGIFMLICASAFTLLGVSQQRYQAESQVLNSFEEARLGLDQIVRDFSDSGYPPQNQFEILPTNSAFYADTPVAWSPGYTTTPLPVTCNVGVDCSTPGFDGLFIETNPTPQIAGSTVMYIRYKLNTNGNITTLYRGVFPKIAGQDPYLTIPDNTLTPFVSNVLNDSTPAQIAQINALYPNMFPGGATVPLFMYTCDTPTGPQDCAAAGAPYDVPTNIRSITITLIVATPTPDPQTGQPRIVELTGRATRINSFQ